MVLPMCELAFLGPAFRELAREKTITYPNYSNYYYFLYFCSIWYPWDEPGSG